MAAYRLELSDYDADVLLRKLRQIGDLLTNIHHCFCGSEIEVEQAEYYREGASTIHRMTWKCAACRRVGTDVFELGAAPKVFFLDFGTQAVVN